MVHLARLAAPERVGQGAAFVHGDGGEVDAVGDVSHRVDVRQVGALIDIHRDAMAVHGDAGGLQLQTSQEWPAAGGQQHTAAGDGVAGRGVNLKLAGAAADAGGPHAAADVDALRLHRLLNGTRQLPVEAAQDLLAAHQLDDLHAEAIEDAGEFAGDEAGAHHHHPFGEPLQVEQVVAHPAQLGAWDGGTLRPPANGDQDALAPQLLLRAVGQLNGDGVGVHEAAPAPVELHTGLLEEADVQGVEPIHLGAHVGQQHRRIAVALAHRPAVAGGVVQLMPHR